MFLALFTTFIIYPETRAKRCVVCEKPITCTAPLSFVAGTVQERTIATYKYGVFVITPKLLSSTQSLTKAQIRY